MAKDPAFLFYPNDWHGGTMYFTHEQKGAYIDLLILQFNSGKFTLAQAKQVLSICFAQVWPILKTKFKNEGELFWNDRLLTEMEKRSKYSESRRNNALMGKKDLKNDPAYASAMHTHMENENENTNRSKNRDGNKKSRTKKNLEVMGIWERCVKAWFEFYETKFQEKPSFAGRDPASFKKLLELVSQRVVVKNFEWTAETCQDHFLKFLQRAYTDAWLSQNFLLQNLVSQFDKIIVNGKNGKINGKEPTGADVDVASAFAAIDRMYGKSGNP